MGVEDQLLGFPEVDPHERHAAVRQLHVCRLDGQRHALERDRLVAPVKLERLAGRKAHRHVGPHRNPRVFRAPRLHEAVHAIVRAVVTAPAQLLKQALRRAAFSPGQFDFKFQDLGQNHDPLAQLGRRLDTPLVLELGSLAADHLAHRCARYRQQPNDLLDRTMLFEIRPPYLADQVHVYHPPKPFSAPKRAKKEH